MARTIRKPPLSSRSVGFPKDRLATMTLSANLRYARRLKFLIGIDRRRSFQLIGGGIVIFLGFDASPAESQDANRLYPADFIDRAGRYRRTPATAVHIYDTHRSPLYNVSEWIV
jgi:hypothetical protein